MKFAAGETYHFEFRPQNSGKLELQTSFIGLHTNVPITVLEPNEAMAEVLFQIDEMGGVNGVVLAIITDWPWCAGSA